MLEWKKDKQRDHRKQKQDDQMYQAQFQWIYQLETIPKQSALCTE